MVSHWFTHIQHIAEAKNRFTSTKGFLFIYRIQAEEE